MGVTVKQLVEDTVLKGSRLLAGEEGLDREVHGFTVMDAPDGYRWIRGREVVFSSTFAFHLEQQAMEVVPRLSEAGASALIIKTERFLRRVPDEMVEAANRLKLPLVQMPPHLSWTETLQSVAELLLHQGMTASRQVYEVYQIFEELTVKGRGLEAVARTLSELTGAPVVITDLFLSLLAATGPECPGGDAERMHRLAQFQGRERFLEEIRQLRGVGYVTAWMDDAPLYVSVMPAVFEGMVLGYVFIPAPPGSMTSVQEAAMKHAGTATALELSRVRLQQQVKNQISEEFIQALLFGPPLHPEELRLRARIANYNLAPRYAVMIVEPDLLSEHAEEMANDELQNALVRQVLSALGGPHRSFVTVRGSCLILLYGMSKTMTRSHVVDLARELQQRLTTVMRSRSPSVSIGVSALNDLGAVREGYEQATAALTVARRAQGQGAIMHWDELGVYQLAVRGLDARSVQDYVERYLKRLFDYDAVHQSHLFQTLHTYFQCNQNMTMTSAQLYLHPKTVKYRLDKALALAGIQSDNRDQTLALELAVKLAPLSTGVQGE